MPFEQAFEIGLSHSCPACNVPLLVIPSFGDDVRLVGFDVICSKCLISRTDWAPIKNAKSEEHNRTLTAQQVLETYGDPLKFWRNVRVAIDSSGKLDINACWLWTRSVDRYGYGWKRVGKNVTRAHRYAYAVSHPRDPLVKGLVIRHHCDTPLCNNPNHLAQGTYLSNLRDCQVRDRMNRKMTYGKARLLVRMAKMGFRTKVLSDVLG